jgi:hypothetical protein
MRSAQRKSAKQQHEGILQNGGKLHGTIVGLTIFIIVESLNMNLVFMRKRKIKN